MVFYYNTGVGDETQIAVVVWLQGTWELSKNGISNLFSSNRIIQYHIE